MSELIEMTKQLWSEYMTGEPENVMQITNLFLDDSVIIGTGKHEYYKNLHRFQIALAEELQERRGIKFQINDLECEELEVSNEVSLVYGRGTIHWQTEDGTVRIHMDNRFTILYKKIEGIWRVMHIHQSTPNLDQLDGEAYPKTLTGQVEAANKTIESLTHLATTDSLTGLINIRTLKEYYAKSDKKDMWIFAIDIDGFKEINDTMGHLQGDHVLINTAKILKHSVREHDLACRMGGDEFILICSGMKSESDATTLVDRITSNIKNITKSDPPDFSISIGITEVHENESFEEAFERADRALYTSKRNGKGKASFIYLN